MTNATINISLAPGDYGSFPNNLQSREYWTTYKGQDSSISSFRDNHKYMRLIFDGIHFNGSVRAHRGPGNATFTIMNVSNIIVKNSELFFPENIHLPEMNDTTAVLISFSSNITLTNVTVRNARTNIYFGSSSNIILEKSDVGYSWGDNLRIISSDNVVIDGNNIHDAKDRYGTGEHIDGITINADLPECNFPQPKNIIVKNNKLINNTGQNIFVWSNYIYCIGYIQNISITNNTIGNTTTIDNPNAQGYGNPLFMPVQFGSVKNFIFNQNTVYGTVAVRLESEGQLMNNLISGYLTYENTTNIIYEDYNLVKGFYAQPNTNRSVLGNFSLQSEVQFANVAAHDYRPVSPLSVCTMSSISGHVGALPCVGQQGNCEIKKAYWKIA